MLNRNRIIFLVILCATQEVFLLKIRVEIAVNNFNTNGLCDKSSKCDVIYYIRTCQERKEELQAPLPDGFCDLRLKYNEPDMNKDHHNYNQFRNPRVAFVTNRTINSFNVQVFDDDFGGDDDFLANFNFAFDPKVITPHRSEVFTILNETSFLTRTKSAKFV